MSELRDHGKREVLKNSRGCTGRKLRSLSQMEKTSQFSEKATPKAKFISQSPKFCAYCFVPTSSHQLGGLFIAKHQREEMERQNESLLRLAQQKQELELQRLKKEEERKNKEETFMFAELVDDNNRRLVETKLTEMELRDVVLEANQSLREALSELGAESQSV